MIEIKCMEDIRNLSAKAVIPEEIVEKISKELVIIKKWSDEFNEVDMENFNTDDFGYGYIVILEGNESEEDFKDLGLMDGLDGVIPEAAESYYINDEKWTRVVVIYNDSYSMSFWLKNCELFNDYEIADRNCSSDEKNRQVEAF